MKKLIPLAVAILTLATSCATHVVVDYQSETRNTGTIKVLPTENTAASFLTVNENLLVNRKYVKSITVNNVPEGQHTVVYSSSSSSHVEDIRDEFTATIEPGQTVSHISTIPPRTTGYWIYNGLVYLGASLIFIAPVL